MQITATQGGSTANGLLLDVFVLTGAKPSASQAGNTINTQFASTLTWTQSITNSAGSSVYGAATPNQSSQAPTASNSTIIDSVSQAGNSIRLVTFHAVNLSAGTTARGFTFGSSLSGGPFAMLEVLAATTLAEDASAPGVVSTTGAGPITTGAFTPPGGSLLVAMVASHGGAAVATMTVSGGSLTWTEKVKNNPSGGFYAGIWIADVPVVAPVISQMARGTAAISRSHTAPTTGPAARPQVTRQAVRGGPAARKSSARTAAAVPVPARPRRAAVRAAVSSARPGRVVVVRSTGAGVVPAAPAAAVAPTGMRDRRPGYLKKRILLGI